MKKPLVVGSGLVIAVVVIVAVTTALLGPSERDKRLDGEVTLSMQGGVCTPSDPGKFKVKKKDRISWTVFNTCGSDQVVSFRDFHILFIPNKGIVSPYPPTSRTIGNGQRDRVEATIEGGAFIVPFTYKYAIYVGPTAGAVEKRLDPDVEIWP